MIEMFAPLKADARAVAGQLLEFLLREGLQNIDQGKELRRRSLSCHVMHITVSIPYESNSGVSVIEGESGRTDESLPRSFAYSFKRRATEDSVTVAIPLRDQIPTRHIQFNDGRAELLGMPLLRRWFVRRDGRLRYPFSATPDLIPLDTARTSFIWGEARQAPSGYEHRQRVRETAEAGEWGRPRSPTGPQRLSRTKASGGDAAIAGVPRQRVAEGTPSAPAHPR
jgi:hypothetical protein